MIFFVRVKGRVIRSIHTVSLTYALQKASYDGRVASGNVLIFISLNDVLVIIFILPFQL